MHGNVAREDAVSELARGFRGRSFAALTARAVLGAVVVLTAALTFAAAASAQQGLTVDFSYSPAAPKAGESVTFTSTSTPEADIVRESWDFNGDGQYELTGHAVAPWFISPGTYSVTLEVQSSTGEIKSASKPVAVYAATPPPPPSQNPAPAPAPAPRPPPAPQPPTPPTGSAIGSPVPVTAIAPFPIVRLTGLYSTDGLRLRLLAVTAPVGVTITVRCAGHGCPYRRQGPFAVRISGTRPVGTARYVRIRGFRGRMLKPGARIQVFVARPQHIGKYTRFTIRRGPPQRVDRCLGPSGKIFSCG